MLSFKLFWDIKEHVIKACLLECLIKNIEDRLLQNPFAYFTTERLLPNYDNLVRYIWYDTIYINPKEKVWILTVLTFRINVLLALLEFQSVKILIYSNFF